MRHRERTGADAGGALEETGLSRNTSRGVKGQLRPLHGCRKVMSPQENQKGGHIRSHIEGPTFSNTKRAGNRGLKDWETGVYLGQVSMWEVLG